ncbi:hypothetical protein BgiBS90_001462 [Biomphalaria glabrata]|nr:hypothetical protein BgiMline_033546 [Biomphalaria glabrata]KAI8799159.1 hypothetical protein BgiBS90_001462 [Biomphalaria glabrata]
MYITKTSENTTRQCKTLKVTQTITQHTIKVSSLTCQYKTDITQDNRSDQREGQLFRQFKPLPVPGGKDDRCGVFCPLPPQPGFPSTSTKLMECLGGQTIDT